MRRDTAPSLLLVALAGSAAPAAAQQLELPGNAVMTREATDADGAHALPTGPWHDGALPTREVTGHLTRQAWRVDGATRNTQELTDTLAAQLETAGFTPLFRCADAACGGFDFRFAQPVLPPPEMFVDLFDYRYLAARKPGADGDAFVTLLISRSGSDAYVQITRIAPQEEPGDMAAAATEGTAVTPLAEALTAQGHAVLRDLDFATGADTLGPGPFASLGALAAFLKADETRRVALVGHTDTVGGMAANLALSGRRARAVKQRLIEAHGVPAARLEAEGIAYLAPTAPNATEAGREANRRVEAVLLTSG